MLTTPWHHGSTVSTPLPHHGMAQTSSHARSQPLHAPRGFGVLAQPSVGHFLRTGVDTLADTSAVHT